MTRYYGFTDNVLSNPVFGVLGPTNLLLSKYSVGTPNATEPHFQAEYPGSIPSSRKVTQG